jgi:hypothetical protein
MSTKDKLGWTAKDYDALLAMAGRLDIPSEWLVAVMYSESQMNPKAKNSLGYRGLIQLGSSELHGMGLKQAQIDDFTNWTPARQIPYAERYFKYWAPKEGGWVSRAQLYQATFLPSTVARLGSAPGVVLARKPKTGCPEKGNVFCSNAPFSRDGKTITVGDLEAKIEERTKSPWSKFDTALEGVQQAQLRITAANEVPQAPTAAITHPASVVPIAFYVPPEQKAFPFAPLLFAGLALSLGGYYLLRQQPRPLLTT